MGGKPTKSSRRAAVWPPEVRAQLAHGVRVTLGMTGRLPEGSMPGEVAAAVAATYAIAAGSDEELIDRFLAPAAVTRESGALRDRVEALALLGGQGDRLARAAETFTAEALWVWSASVEELSEIKTVELRVAGRTLLDGTPGRVASHARRHERNLKRALALLDKAPLPASPIVLRREALMMRLGTIAATVIADDQDERARELESRRRGIRKLTRQGARLTRFASVVYRALKSSGWTRAEVAALLVDADRCLGRPSRSPKPAHRDHPDRRWRSERSDADGGGVTWLGWRRPPVGGERDP